MAIYQIAAQMKFLGQEMRNIFYYETDTVLTNSQLQEVVDGIRADYASLNTAVSLVNDWQLYGCHVRRVDTGGLLGNDFSFTGGALTGSNTGDPLPTQVAVLVIGRGLTTKPNQVRTYLTGFEITAGASTGEWAGTTLTAAEDWADDMNGQTYTSGIADRVSVTWAAATPPFVSSSNELDSYRAQPVPATQRRRRLGVGG